MLVNVNFSTLNTLVAEVGDETIRSLLVVFSDEMTQYQQILEQKPSLEEIRKITCYIKSSAATFGADKLAQLARECEQRGRLGQDVRLQKQLPKLAEMLEQISVQYKDLSLRKNLLDSQG